MRTAIAIFLSAIFAAAYAEPGINFSVGGKQYRLKGGHAVVNKVKGRTQLILAVRDTTSKAQIAITAEIPDGALDKPLELTSELHLLSAVIVNTRGIYSIVPQVTLARDDFMRYVKKEEIQTGEMEDDPHDRPQDRIAECREGLTEHCHRLMHKHRRKKPKIKVRYSTHGPTWVNKSRSERIATGDGIMREEKYRDTSFILRLTPVVAGGKVTSITGSFAGIMTFNEGMNPAVKMPVQSGEIELQVHDAR